MILSIRNCGSAARNRDQTTVPLNKPLRVHPCNRNVEAGVCFLIIKIKKPFISAQPFLFHGFRFLRRSSTSAGVPAIKSTFRIRRRRKRERGKGTCQQYIPSLRDVQTIVLSLSSAKSFCMPSILYKDWTLYFILTRTFPVAASVIVFAIVCCQIHNILADVKIWRPEYGFGRETWTCSIKGLMFWVPPCAR